MDERLLRAVAEEGYQTPTPIQEQAIPPVLKGRDLLGIAQTGTGKTAAFTLPILHRLAAGDRGHSPKTARVVVLVPTRELAVQVHENVMTYGRHLNIRTSCIYGGVAQGMQVASLAHGVDVLVATPGRLLDFVKQDVLHLGNIEVAVLDEADRMLDLGFVDDIRKIVGLLPATRQTLFFSATMPAAIEELSGAMLTDPVRIEVTPASTPIERIVQILYYVEAHDKLPLLRTLLNHKNASKVLVFTKTRDGADRVCQYLHKVGIAADSIHSDRGQFRRLTEDDLAA